MPTKKGVGLSADNVVKSLVPLTCFPFLDNLESFPGNSNVLLRSLKETDPNIIQNKIFLVNRFS